MWRHARSLAPGILLCVAVSVAAMLLQIVEQAVLGRPYIEALVIAILLGVLARTAARLGAVWRPGIRFSAHTVLEIAVMLLGASISFQTIRSAGPTLLAGIALVVTMSIGASYGVGRLLGLSERLALLVACGNSICGNSAIAAVAPIIGADGQDVASSIAFTAVLGVAVVLGLPLLIPVLGLSASQYGILAGLTVYAVPQVLAATAPVAVVSLQIGTIVKLMRVLMLGPVVLVISLFASWRVDPSMVGERGTGARRVAIRHLVPWFIVGFLGLAAARSIGMIPNAAETPLSQTANILTIIAMAALGLEVDLRSLAKAGVRVTLAVVASLLMLSAISLGLIHALGPV